MKFDDHIVNFELLPFDSIETKGLPLAMRDIEIYV